MKVKTLISFRDIKASVTRKVNEEFELTRERFNEINNCQYCKKNNKPLIAVIEQEVIEDKPKKETKKK